MTPLDRRIGPSLSSPRDDMIEQLSVDGQLRVEQPPPKSFLLRRSAPISNADVMKMVRQGGYIRNVIFEAQDDSRAPKHLVFLLASWRKGYNVLHCHYPDEPRTFRDLHRLLVLVRFQYRFTGAVAIKRASEVPTGKRHWRLSL